MKQPRWWWIPSDTHQTKVVAFKWTMLLDDDAGAWFDDLVIACTAWIELSLNGLEILWQNTFSSSSFIRRKWLRHSISIQNSFTCSFLWPERLLRGHSQYTQITQVCTARVAKAVWFYRKELLVELSRSDLCIYSIHLKQHCYALRRLRSVWSPPDLIWCCRYSLTTSYLSSSLLPWYEAFHNTSWVSLICESCRPKLLIRAKYNNAQVESYPDQSFAKLFEILVAIF